MSDFAGFIRVGCALNRAIRHNKITSFRENPLLYNRILRTEGRCMFPELYQSSNRKVNQGECD